MDPRQPSGGGIDADLTALTAAFAPGWKATHVNPMVALRAE